MIPRPGRSVLERAPAFLDAIRRLIETGLKGAQKFG